MTTLVALLLLVTLLLLFNASRALPTCFNVRAYACIRAHRFIHTHIQQRNCFIMHLVSVVDDRNARYNNIGFVCVCACVHVCLFGKRVKSKMVKSDAKRSACIASVYVPSIKSVGGIGYKYVGALTVCVGSSFGICVHVLSAIHAAPQTLQIHSHSVVTRQRIHVNSNENV